MSRHNFWGKLLKIVKASKDEPKCNSKQLSKCLEARERRAAERKRRQSSLSSHLSHVEPMPTIDEVDEEEEYAYYVEFSSEVADCRVAVAV